MNYGFGKTFTLEPKFHALNGCIQYYTFESNADLVAAPTEGDEVKTAIDNAVAQANYLRVLETLRGVQPVITVVDGKVLKFTAEQPWTYGSNEPHQVSKNWDAGKVGVYVEESKKAIEALFNDEYGKLKALKAANAADITAVEELSKLVLEDDDATDLFKSVEVDVAF